MAKNNDTSNSNRKRPTASQRRGKNPPTASQRERNTINQQKLKDKDEKLAIKREQGRIRQQRLRDKRKTYPSEEKLKVLTLGGSEDYCGLAFAGLLYSTGIMMVRSHSASLLQQSRLPFNMIPHYFFHFSAWLAHISLE